MYLSISLLIAAIPFLAAAAPAPAPAPQESTSGEQYSGPIGLMATRSASSLHFQTINASGQAFWIGKETSSYCPLGSLNPPLPCPPGNKTVISVYRDATGVGSASMCMFTPAGGAGGGTDSSLPFSCPLDTPTPPPSHSFSLFPFQTPPPPPTPTFQPNRPLLPTTTIISNKFLPPNRRQRPRRPTDVHPPQWRPILHASPLGLHPPGILPNGIHIHPRRELRIFRGQRGWLHRLIGMSGGRKRNVPVSDFRQSKVVEGCGCPRRGGREMSRHQCFGDSR